MEFLQFDETTARLLGWGEFCGWLAELAVTPLAKRRCQELVPFADAEAIKERQLLLARLEQLAAEGNPPPLEAVEDIEADLSRAEKGGALAPDVIRRVAQAMIISSRARRYLVQDRGGISALAERMEDLSALGRDLSQAFDESGQLRDSASPELGPLRRRARELADGVRRRLEQMIRRPTVAACLSDSFVTQRSSRYVIPVRADAPERIAGIVHDTSQSGATLFIEPAELVEEGNRLKLAEAALQEHELRLLAEFSREIGEAAEPLRQSLQGLAELDLLWAMCRAAEIWSGRPADVGEGSISLLAARHPLMLVAGQKVIANDIRLDGDRHGLVISGPNAGGKTVTLKTAGLLVLLAQAGMALPAAEGSRLPLFARIAAVMGDEQDIKRGLSTFTGQLLRIQEIMREAGPRCLVLVDEVLADTEPGQGAALAAEVLRALVDKGATVMVTTHFELLKQLAFGDSRFANASVGFDLETLSPTYELHPDTPGRSLTFDIARNLGLETGILDRAAGTVGQERRLTEEMLEALENERRALARTRERLEGELEGARRRTEQITRAAAELDEQRRTIRREGKQKLLEDIQAARRRVAELTERLRRSPAPVEVSRAGEELKRLEDTVRREMKGPAPPARDKIAPGDTVRVEGFGAAGEVLSVDERQGLVCVRMGRFQTRVTREMVRLAPAAEGRPAAADRQASVLVEGTEAEVRTPENTLDLRGLRADEALGLLEKFLDDLYARGRQVAFIVHGHGTGALRTAVRRYLEDSPYNCRFRAGALDEGGEGITVVKFT